MKIWIVYGSTGEYSDRVEWAVMAYTDELKARVHVENCTAWFREYGPYANLAPREPKWAAYIRWNDQKLANPYDPNMSVDYTGTRWYLDEVELCES